MNRDFRCLFILKIKVRNKFRWTLYISWFEVRKHILQFQRNQTQPKGAEKQTALVKIWINIWNKVHCKVLSSWTSAVLRFLLNGEKKDCGEVFRRRVFFFLPISTLHLLMQCVNSILLEPNWNFLKLWWLRVLQTYSTV